MSELEYHDVVKSEIEHYNGNMAQFSRHMAKVMPELSPESHRWRLRMLKQHMGDIFPVFETIDYNAEIPKKFDGTQAQLIRIMQKRFPEISKAGWESRVRAAWAREAVTKTETPHFIVEHLKKKSSSQEELWNAIEERSKAAILANTDARWATFHMKSKQRYIGIAFQSDQHIGNPFCDHERLREDTESIERHPDCYVIHAGDYIDNFMIDKPRPAMKAPIPPSIQWQLCEHYINMSPNSLMAIVAGNHDLWTAGATDYDPLKRLAQDRGVLYHPYELNLKVIHGDIPYHISIRHKRRGNSNLDPSRVIKKMWDDGECDFDIGVIGHHHTPSVVPFTRHAVERWALRPGAYKTIDSFGEMCGFPRERPTSPMVVLDSETRDIQAFTDLRHGLRLLNTLNGRKANAFMDE
jgi:predicted phosphodiesterase